ncbi:hypothetical protein HDU98_011289 [Podochytrium sp. JEL0797]|nr:hypothetical protein HDU98_011289 [Podochytrium sp. JEL0797]
MAAPNWKPDSWKEKKIVQDVIYEDQAHLGKVLGKLKRLPPLVSEAEIKNLKKQLAEVAENKRFLLQGGDCAELFDYCEQAQIESKLKVLLQMSLILVWGGRTSVVRIARMAGQYAKPRSKPMETVNGAEYHAFRGDNVNGNDLEDRKPDPERLIGAYFHSAATINYVRTLLASGFADLHHPGSWNLEAWDLAHVRNPAIRKEYEGIVDRLYDALDFMKTIGADDSTDSFNSVDMFMSHEGLLLDYEQQFTQQGSDKKFYNLGTHFLWIGDRTRQLDGAHIEYFRGLANPVGVKVGPSMEPAELVRVLDILDPDFETGKVTLITRYGHDKIEQYLPGHIKAVQGTKHKVVWCCDPMHGNTETVNGVKTRRFDNIAEELGKAFRTHTQNGSSLGGVHFELTGDRVTEAIGGSMELSADDLSTNYQTFCDPRLNYEQSLDIAFSIAKFFQEQRSHLPAEKPLPLWMNVTAGAIAGVTEILVCYPLDVVKTRFQLQVTGAENAYKNLGDAFTKIIKQEGFGALYRGILPPIMVEAPKRAIKFTANEEYTRLFKPHVSDSQTLAILTGMSAGLTESVVVVSPELIKIRLQDKRNVGLYKSTGDCVQKIWAAEGFSGFWRGIEATALRHVLWNAGYFGCIQYVRSVLPKAESKEAKMLNNMAAGTIGGTVGTILNTPFDVVKSRVQGQIAAPFKYNWAVPAVVTIVREEGFTALYKGFVPKVLRLGPGGGILLVTFDVVTSYMRKNFM